MILIFIVGDAVFGLRGIMPISARPRPKWLIIITRVSIGGSPLRRRRLYAIRSVKRDILPRVTLIIDYECDIRNNTPITPPAINTPAEPPTSFFIGDLIRFTSAGCGARRINAARMLLMHIQGMVMLWREYFGFSRGFSSLGI